MKQHPIRNFVILALAVGGFFVARAMTGPSTTDETTEEGSQTAQVGLPEAVEVPSPDRPVVDLDEVENLSEAVANEFLSLSDALRRREFEKALTWFSNSFAGDAVTDLAVSSTDALPLGAQRINSDVAQAPVVGREEFIAGFEAILGPWQRVEHVLWKVKAAEFQAAANMWGRIHFKVTALGTGPDGGPRHLQMWANAKVIKVGGRWSLERVKLENQTFLERSAPLFRDVTTAAGVEHSGIRFGKPGNTDFAWNGIASGDADGDGLFDVFVPSRPKSMLYLAREGGTPFVEEAESRGLGGQDGGTGAVFFDADGDGDQDLAVGGVGWRESTGRVGGNPLHLYMNDGAGNFTEEGAERGFDALCDGYSLVVFDAENDGLLDVYVANYGRVAVKPNDSWVDAKNGSQDGLFTNTGAGKFKEVALERGLAESRWSYAAAAADYDEDGDMDIYVANDYGTNAFWNNNGDGHFTDVAAKLGVEDLGNGMGCAFGDLNSDGLLDLYVVNMTSTAGRRILSRLATKDESWNALSKMASGNSIFLAERDADGEIGFERMDPKLGGIGASWAWSTALVDIDMDGLLDIYCCNGYVTGDTAADT